MISPMLAVPREKVTITNWYEWAIEEKYDGHRLIIEVSSGGVQAHGRPRKHAGDLEGKSMATKALPPHLIEALSRLPRGTYDGELMGGETSTDVTRKDLVHLLHFVVFDVLALGANELMSKPYDHRRAVLEGLNLEALCGPAVKTAIARPVNSEADVKRFVDSVWSRGGEGAILKRRAAPYRQGKRSPDFVKFKKEQTAVCTITGWSPSRGEKVDRGPYAMVLLQDDGGDETSVKTKDDETLARVVHEAQHSAHPFVGRRLVIEYQDKTPKGGYRHPRWDRFEDE